MPSFLKLQQSYHPTIARNLDENQGIYLCVLGVVWTVIFGIYVIYVISAGAVNHPNPSCPGGELEPSAKADGKEVYLNCDLCDF